MFDNATTRRLAVMNIALRGIEVDFGPEHADTFRRDRRLNFELRTSNFELGNGPPFNDSDWFRKDDDVRFSSLSASMSFSASDGEKVAQPDEVSPESGERAGVRCRNDGPPKGNANFAWVQHFMSVFFLSAYLLGNAGANAAELRVIKGRVVGVHDGDTVTILTSEKTQVKVRLEGIDAPELKQSFGQKSKAELSAIVYAKEVAVSDHGTDRYKRTLGRIKCGEIDVNLEMVKRGMAWRYEQYSKEPALVEAQANAKERGVGLWAERDPVPPWVWRAKKPRTPKAETKCGSQFKQRAADHGEVPLPAASHCLLVKRTIDGAC